MIVKYLTNGVWGYIDNVRQIANKGIDTDELIKQYDAEVADDKRENIAYVEGSEDITAQNKAYLMAAESVEDIFDRVSYGNSHIENLLEFKVDENLPANIILLYLNEHKEYDTVVLITNQKTYLLNDKGQNIERLV